MLRAGLEPDTLLPPQGSTLEGVSFGFEPAQPGHVLETLARSIGPIPPVLRPDTGTDDAGVTIIEPSSDEMPAPGDRGSRNQLFGEIARGGMGAVFKGRDHDLGRDLAFKVLLEGHQEKPQRVRREDDGLPGGHPGPSAGGRTRAGGRSGACDRGTAPAQDPARVGGLGPGLHHAGRAEHDLIPPAAGGPVGRAVTVLNQSLTHLDDWAAIRRGKRSDAVGAARLSEAARVADPDPWRAEVRTVLDRPDKTAPLAGPRSLAETAQFDELGAISLHLLEAALHDAGDTAMAESVLRTAKGGIRVMSGSTTRWGRCWRSWIATTEAIRFYTAARAIRPETSFDLALNLERRGDYDKAYAVFLDPKALRPNARNLVFFNGFLKDKKRLTREAEKTHQAAVAPSWATTVRLGSPTTPPAPRPWLALV